MMLYRVIFVAGFLDALSYLESRLLEDDLV